MDNEDQSFAVFSKLFTNTEIMGNNVQHLRCKKMPVMTTLSNKFSKVCLEYTPSEGEYVFEYKDTAFTV
jgi:mitochondrial chaperone BCS1